MSRKPDKGSTIARGLGCQTLILQPFWLNRRERETLPQKRRDMHASRSTEILW
jgi:hypothetical protein